MKGTGLDPHIIKWVFIGLMLLGRFLIASNRKRQAKDKALRPSQSSPAPPPISSPSVTPSQPIQFPRKAAKDKPAEAESPWSTTKGPFD